MKIVIGSEILGNLLKNEYLFPEVNVMSYVDWIVNNLNWIIPVLIGVVFSYLGTRQYIISKSPKYIIEYRFDRNVPKKISRKFTQLHKLSILNQTDNEFPRVIGEDVGFGSATSTTDGFIKIRNPFGRQILTAKKGERESGGWYPYKLVFRPEEKRRFVPSGTKDIIWKFKYKSKFGIHCSYQLFRWESTDWSQEGWDGWYLEGLLGHLFFIGSFMNKADSKVKEWKKLNEKFKPKKF